MIRRVLAPALLAAVTLLLVVPGCSPKPGKTCDAKDQPICLDPATALECREAVWVASPCLGPKGCVATPDDFACDTSYSKIGDPCTKETRYACSVDKKDQLRCKGGKWVSVAQCTKEPGCEPSSFLNSCPGAVSKEGDECDPGSDPKKKSYTCSVDKKAALLCKDGKWKSTEQCLGKDGCDSSMFTVKCDGPVAKEGDFCELEETPDYACSPDGKAEMICTAKGWGVAKKCRGAEGCTSSILGVKCDVSVMDPGEACDHEGSAVCSTDGKTILECKGGKFQKSTVCSTACKVTSISITCE
ncbi:MAG: hypothetical protein U0441_15755 [Polyangiaceae bacterium]